MLCVATEGGVVEIDSVWLQQRDTVSSDWQGLNTVRAPGCERAYARMLDKPNHEWLSHTQ